jgi:hypothetical protein
MAHFPHHQNWLQEIGYQIETSKMSKMFFSFMDSYCGGARNGVVIETLCYKSEGRGFENR